MDVALCQSDLTQEAKRTNWKNQIETWPRVAKSPATFLLGSFGTCAI